MTKRIARNHKKAVKHGRPARHTIRRAPPKTATQGAANFGAQRMARPETITVTEFDIVAVPEGYEEDTPGPEASPRREIFFADEF